MDVRRGSDRHTIAPFGIGGSAPHGLGTLPPLSIDVAGISVAASVLVPVERRKGSLSPIVRRYRICYLAACLTCAYIRTGPVAGRSMSGSRPSRPGRRRGSQAYWRPDVRPIGKGAHELRVHYGPGYRVYFGMDGGTLYILLGGGDKRRQQRDIDEAHTRWADYKARKRKR